MADKWDPVAGENYGWVVMVVLLGYLLNFAQMIWLRIRRGRDSVSPPAMYAEDKPMFNGAQRAHQNTLEQLPYFLTSLLLAGLRHPEEAAGLGCGWILARVIFSLGYWTGKPIYRMPGVFLTTLVQAVLVGFMVSTAAGYLDWW